MHIEDQRKVSSDNELRTFANLIALGCFALMVMAALLLVFSNSVDETAVGYVGLAFIFGLFLSTLLKGFADVIYLLKKIADKADNSDVIYLLKKIADK